MDTAHHELQWRVELEKILLLALKMEAEGNVVGGRRLLVEGFDGIDYRMAMKLMSGEITVEEAAQVRMKDLILEAKKQAYYEQATF